MITLTFGCTALFVAACGDDSDSSDDSHSAGGSTQVMGGAGSSSQLLGGTAGFGGHAGATLIAQGGEGNNMNIPGGGQNCLSGETRACLGAFACPGVQVCDKNSWLLCACSVNEGGAGNEGGAASSAGSSN